MPTWRHVAGLFLLAALLLGATVTRPNPVLVTGSGLLFPDGTVSAPPMAFASNPGLGWYRFAQDQMGLGGAVVLTGTGPHAIGGTASEANSMLLLKGTRVSTADIRTLDVQGDVQAAAGFSAEGINLRPAFRLPAAGAANNWEGLDILLTPTGSGGTVTQIDGILMRTFAAPAGTSIATGIYIAAPPTGATTNRSIWVASGGITHLDGPLLFGDNTYDIGASGATRPRTGYFATSLIVGPSGTLTTYPQLTPAASGVRYLCISTTGVIASQAAACVGT